MNVHHKPLVKLTCLLLSLLALTLFLVACGNSGSSTTISAPTSTPTPTPGGQSYTGDGYSLSYPLDWKVTTQSGVAEFSSNAGNPLPLLTIRTAAFDNTPGTPGVSLDQQMVIEETTLTGNQNFQEDKTVASTTSIGGDTWKEFGATYDVSVLHTKAVVFGDQHPASTGKIFIIRLTDTAASYDQDYSTIIQPIFNSFKFS